MSDDKIRSDLAFSLIPEWLLDSQVSDKAIRLYCLLHRYADNQTHECFPSIKTLARRAHCTARTVQRALDELVELGAVKKKPRHSVSGGVTSNLYVLKRVPSKMSGGGDKNDTLTRTTELEPDELFITRHFDNFWTEYPRRVGKGQARRAFKTALSKATPEVIMAGLKLYKAQVESQSIEFIAYPSTWLNGERWDDDYESETLKRRSNKREPNYLDGVRLVAKYQAREVDEIESA